MWWLWTFILGGTRTGIETGQWLREVCGVPVVFVTAHSDAETLERIHAVVPTAPVLSKPVYRQTLADAVTAVTHCRLSIGGRHNGLLRAHSAVASGVLHFRVARGFGASGALCSRRYS